MICFELLTFFMIASSGVVEYSKIPIYANFFKNNPSILFQHLPPVQPDPRPGYGFQIDYEIIGSRTYDQEVRGGLTLRDLYFSDVEPSFYKLTFARTIRTPVLEGVIKGGLRFSPSLDASSYWRINIHDTAVASNNIGFVETCAVQNFTGDDVTFAPISYGSTPSIQTNIYRQILDPQSLVFQGDYEVDHTFFYNPLLIVTYFELQIQRKVVYL